MSDFQKDRIDRPRDEGLYIASSNEKKEKEKFSKLPAQNENKLLFASFLSYLDHLINAFTLPKKFKGTILDYHTFRKDLLQLKHFFLQLKEEDLSHSSPFALELSELWCRLWENLDKAVLLEKNPSSNSISFKKMMHAIKNYPQETEHSLGYYFFSHAGKEWIPFPFIEILENLHKEAQEKKEESILARWIHLIDKILANLLPETPPFQILEEP